MATKQPSTMFITGASSGIGLATAVQFHQNGWNVVASMRSPENAPAELISLDSSRLLITKCDVTDLDSINAAVSATLEKFGQVHCVINNAAYGLVGVFEGLPREKIIDQVNTVFIGTMDVTRAFLPHLRQTAKSSDKNSVGIISLSSGAGTVSFPSSSVYSGVKFAVEYFTESLFYELSNYNVFVKIVVPFGGDIVGTSFSDRLVKEMVANNNEEINAAYAAYGEKVVKVLGPYREIVCSSNDVAHKIYEAATDHTSKMRYFVGKLDHEILKLKYRGANCEEADEKYTGALRKIYGF